MRNDEIHRLNAEQDKDFKAYVDLKIRAVKKQLSLFIWIGKNPWWSALIFVVCIFIGIWISHRIDVSKTIENVTGVKVTDDRHDEVERLPQ